MTTTPVEEKIKEIPVVVDVTGKCQVVINRKRGEEKICGATGECEVFVRNGFGLFSAWICGPHFEKHTEFFEKRRAQQLENAQL